MAADPRSNYVGNGTFPSGADLSAKIGYGAKFSAATLILAAATPATSVACIEDGGAASGDQCSAVLNGPAKAYCGETWAAGDPLTTNASSEWVIADSQNDYVHAVALTACTATKLGAIYVYGYPIVKIP